MSRERVSVRKFLKREVVSFTFKETVTVESVRRVTVPRPFLHAQQAELLRHLCRRHGVWQVLLVGKDEQEALFHLAVVQDLVQLVARLVDPRAVLRVDDKDEALGPRVIVPPQRPDLVLTADVLTQRSTHVSGSVYSTC